MPSCRSSRRFGLLTAAGEIFPRSCPEGQCAKVATANPLAPGLIVAAWGWLAYARSDAPRTKDCTSHSNSVQSTRRSPLTVGGSPKSRPLRPGRDFHVPTFAIRSFNRYRRAPSTQASWALRRPIARFCIFCAHRCAPLTVHLGRRTRDFERAQVRIRCGSDRHDHRDGSWGRFVGSGL